MDHISVGSVTHKVQRGAAVQKHGVGACSDGEYLSGGTKGACGWTCGRNVEIACEGVHGEG